MSEQAWALLLEFDSDHPEFTRGFEAGRLWTLLESGKPLTLTLHRSNEEMVQRIMDTRGWGCTSTPLGESFVEVTCFPMPGRN